MPFFDFLCDSCKHVSEDVFICHHSNCVFCPQCKKEMRKLPSCFALDCFPADGIHLEHVSKEGKTFFSKTEMRKYANKHDLELGAL